MAADWTDHWHDPAGKVCLMGPLVVGGDCCGSSGARSRASSAFDSCRHMKGEMERMGIL